MSESSRALLAQYFDPSFYVGQNKDVRESGLDPLTHWMTHGHKEGREPAPWFPSAKYRLDAGLSVDTDPFLHLLANNRARADELRQAWAKAPGGPAAKRAKPLMQPVYSLRRQISEDGPVVFTAISGTRHALPNNTTHWPDRRVYTDTPFELQGWQSIPSLYWDSQPKLTVLFHKYAVASLFETGTKLIWIDSRVSVQGHVLDHISDTLDRADICLFTHYERDCVYDELGAIVLGKRASHAEADDFENFLAGQHFPRNGGLFETGVMGMKVSPSTSAAMRRVFGLCRRHIPRDQVVLPLVLAQSQLEVAVFDDGKSNLRNTPGVFVHPW